MYAAVEIENPKQISREYPELTDYQKVLALAKETRQLARQEIQQGDEGYTKKVEEILQALESKTALSQDYDRKIKSNLTLIEMLKQKLARRESNIITNLFKVLNLNSQNFTDQDYSNLVVQNYELHNKLEEVNKDIKILTESLIKIQEEQKEITKNMRRRAREKVKGESSKVRKEEKSLYDQYLEDIPKRDVRAVIEEYREKYGLQCFVHALQWEQELNTVSRFKKGINFSDLGRTALVLEPTLCTSSCRIGDIKENRFSPDGYCGLMVTGGEVEACFNRDVGTYAENPYKRLYPNKPNLLLSKKIDESFSERPTSGGGFQYDEFNVKNPKFSGVYIDLEKIKNLSTEERMNIISQIKDFAEENNLPYFFLDKEGFKSPEDGHLIDPLDLPTHRSYSREEKIQLVEEKYNMFIQRNPEVIKTKAILENYFTGLCYKQIFEIIDFEKDLHQQLSNLYEQSNVEEFTPYSDQTSKTIFKTNMGYEVIVSKIQNESFGETYQLSLNKETIIDFNWNERVYKISDILYKEERERLGDEEFFNTYKDMATIYFTAGLSSEIPKEILDGMQNKIGTAIQKAESLNWNFEKVIPKDLGL